MKNLKHFIFTLVSFFLNIIGYRIVKMNGKVYFEKNIFFDEARVYRHFFKSSDNLLIVDVGAHIGQSVKKYLKTFKNCTVHSFEPVNDTYKVLKKSFLNNNSVILNKKAISSEQGEIEMHITGNLSSGNSPIMPNSAQAFSIDKVPATSLDNYFNENNLKKINILKIDTQGYERECLEGARFLLKNSLIDLIKIEVMFHKTYKRRTSFRMIEEILHQYNYYLYDICSIKKSSKYNSTLIVDAIYKSDNL